MLFSWSETMPIRCTVLVRMYLDGLRCALLPHPHEVHFVVSDHLHVRKWSDVHSVAVYCSVLQHEATVRVDGGAVCSAAR